jgi:hypothetical protein
MGRAGHSYTCWLRAAHRANARLRRPLAHASLNQQHLLQRCRREHSGGGVARLVDELIDVAVALDLTLWGALRVDLQQRVPIDMHQRPPRRGLDRAPDERHGTRDELPVAHGGGDEGVVFCGASAGGGGAGEVVSVVGRVRVPQLPPQLAAAHVFV